MPPLVRGATGSNSGSGTVTAFTPSLPAARATGDLLIAVVVSSTATVPTRPAAATSVRSVADAAMHLDVVRWTEAGAAAAAWSKTAVCKWAAAVVTIAAGTWDTVTPLDVENGTNEASATAVAAHTAPTVSVGTPDCLLVAAFATLAAATWTNTQTGPVMLEASDSASSGTTSVSAALYHSGTNDVPTAAISRTATASVASVDGCMWVGAVRPGPNSVGISRWAEGHPAGVRYIRQAVQQATNY